MEVKQIPGTPVNASAETREGDKRRQSGNRRGRKPDEKKTAEAVTTQPAVTEEAPVASPSESQLLDSKTVIELMTKPKTPATVATATFSRQAKSRKPASRKVIDEKKVNRQA